MRLCLAEVSLNVLLSLSPYFLIGDFLTECKQSYTHVPKFVVKNVLGPPPSPLSPPTSLIFYCYFAIFTFITANTGQEKIQYLYIVSK